MRRLALALAVGFLLTAASPAPLVTGLDHIPIAVRDLEKARADYERLGFVLKPGRAHADGIRNAHVKFLDRTEIELITAAQPTDRLAAAYVDFLRGGDGPAYWGLRAPDLERMTAVLREMNLSPDDDGDVVTFAQAGLPHRLFFAHSEPSPTDMPGYFVHPNTAFHLQGIWLAAGAGEAGLLTRLGLHATAGPVCAPFAGQAEKIAMPLGDISFVHAASGRTILGATILVRSLTAARAVFMRNDVPFRTLPCGPGLWLSPDMTHGAWLELKEP